MWRSRKRTEFSRDRMLLRAAGPPLSLSKPVKALAELVADRRARLDQAWLELARELDSQPQPLQVTYDVLPAAAPSSDRIVDDLAERHKARAAELSAELAEEDAKIADLRVLLGSLTDAAAAFPRELRAMPTIGAAFASEYSVSSPPSSSEPSFAPARVPQPARQADGASAASSAAASAEQRAVLARGAAWAREMRAMLATGASLHRWDRSTRTLHPTRVRLVANGRALQSLDAGAVGPLTIQLSAVDAIEPSAATGAFVGGLIPPEAWLYFSLRWRRSALPPAVVHFACNTRTECTTWIRALQQIVSALLPHGAGAEAAPISTAVGSRVWSHGEILWRQVRTLVEERARARGQRPLALLAATVQQAAADARITRERMSAAPHAAADRDVARRAHDTQNEPEADVGAHAAAAPAARPRRKKRVGRRGSKPPQSPQSQATRS